MANLLKNIINGVFGVEAPKVQANTYGSFTIEKDAGGLVAVFRAEGDTSSAGARYRAEALPELSRGVHKLGLDGSAVLRAQRAMEAGRTTAQINAPAPLKKLEFAECYELKDVGGEPTCFFMMGYRFGDPLPSYIHGANAGAPPIRVKDLPGLIERYKSEGYETWQLEGALKKAERQKAPALNPV